MASAAVRNAFIARLSSGWSRAPIVTPNTTGDVPADGSPFLVVTFPVSREEQITLGATGTRVFREEGGARFSLMVPIGAGMAPFDQWVEEIKVLFRAVQFNGVSTFAPDGPAIEDSTDDGAYFGLHVVVDYYADILA